MGMPTGVCPEKWVMDNPGSILKIQASYIDAGSDIIYTCTFGANRKKLGEYGLGSQTVQINRTLAGLSRQAAGDRCLVAGDISSTGKFIKPLGDMDFEECVDIYREQVAGLLEGGVDLFIIETMMDIQEARAALLAVKENCDLPVCVSMTFDESRKTLTGTSPEAALITLQSLGADAVGINCSTGPVQMVEMISAMKPYAKVPLLAKPNAGLPRFVDGSTVFDMGAEEFGSYAESLIQAGATLIGGCCGTSPQYIRELKKNCDGLKPLSVDCTKETAAVTSARKFVLIESTAAEASASEGIMLRDNGKLLEEIQKGSAREFRKLAREQAEKGAKILKVNLDLSGPDGTDAAADAVTLISSATDMPLCFESSSSEILKKALRVYPGRALISRTCLDEKETEKLMPEASKYGAVFTGGKI
jgi:5-methyltetrahydrofolate--homocysteine methyltransferase